MLLSRRLSGAIARAWRWFVHVDGLKNWKPSCEQAKYIAQASRIIGLGFFAAIGYHDTIGLLTGRVHGWHVAVTAFFAFLMWLEFELLGYVAIGKGDCQ